MHGFVAVKREFKSHSIGVLFLRMCYTETIMVITTNEDVRRAQTEAIIADLDDVVTDLISQSKLDTAEFVAKRRDELVASVYRACSFGYTHIAY
jgi:hypothetical protein